MQATLLWQWLWCVRPGCSQSVHTQSWDSCMAQRGFACSSSSSCVCSRGVRRMLTELGKVSVSGVWVLLLCIVCVSAYFFVALLVTRSLVISGMKIAIFCYRTATGECGGVGWYQYPPFPLFFTRCPVTGVTAVCSLSFSCRLFSVAALLNWTLEPCCDYFLLQITF